MAEKKTTEMGAVSEESIGGNGKTEDEIRAQAKKDAQLEVLKDTIKSGDITGAFKQTPHSSAMDYLVNPGTDPHGLLMRGEIPDVLPPSMAFVVSFNIQVAKCEEYGDDTQKAELYRIFASMVSMDGKGREQLVRSIIGGNEFNNREQKGLGNWVKKLAFGGNKRGDVSD